MRNLVNAFRLKGPYLSIPILLAPFILLGGLYLLNERYQYLNSLQTGPATCFTRAGQTFTAKMINEKSSNYLSENFINLTEECYGEVLSSYQKNGQKLAEVDKVLNELSTDVHWFHDFILKSGNPENFRDFQKTLSGKYLKIELGNGQVWDLLEGQKQGVMNQFYGLLGLGFLVLLAGVLNFIPYWRHKNKELGRVDSLERESLKLLEKGEVSSREIEEVLTQGLKASHLYQTSRLVNKLVDLSPVPYQAVLEEKGAPRPEVARPAPQIAAPDVASYLEIVDIGEVLSKVLGLLSQKIFSAGILIDYQLRRDHQVWAQAEAMEQIFYNLMVNLVSSLEGAAEKKKITISAVEDGNQLCLELMASGQQTRPVAIDPANYQDEKSSLELGLEICKEFMQEFQGDFDADAEQFFGQNEKVVKFVFKLTPQEDHQVALTTLKKGKKKDLLREFQGQTL